MHASYLFTAFAAVSAVVAAPNWFPPPPPPIFSFPPIPFPTGKPTLPGFPTPTWGPIPHPTKPPGQDYVKGYPICKVAGFTEVSPKYVETIYKASGSTLSECVNKCREQFVKKLGSCQSIAFAEKYGQCIFYNKIVQETFLIKDGSSNFVHYDLTCPII